MLKGGTAAHLLPDELVTPEGYAMVVKNWLLSCVGVQVYCVVLREHKQASPLYVLEADIGHEDVMDEPASG